MNILRKKTYGWLKAQRDLLVNARAFSIDEEDRAALQKAIQGLEGEMYRRELVVVKSAIVAITALVLLSIVSGCQTFKGATGDSAWILQKLSDNVQTQEK